MAPKKWVRKLETSFSRFFYEKDNFEGLKVAVEICGLIDKQNCPLHRARRSK